MTDITDRTVGGWKMLRKRVAQLEVLGPVTLASCPNLAFTDL